MTGRSHRMVRAGSKYRYTPRAERAVSLSHLNLHERARFQRGEKLIAILSDAGATGVSLHADRGSGNQRRRLHLVPELGWSASKVVQQFGRTHRTNQSTPPEYCLLSCESAGESLTASAVARRLEGMGALTKGDRSAGRGETGELGRNLETATGVEAVRALLGELRRGRAIRGADCSDVEVALLCEAKTVRQFLTRLQASAHPNACRAHHPIADCCCTTLLI